MKTKYCIWYCLVFFNVINCFSQIVNEGILHISSSTSVYFGNEYTNKISGNHNNNGNLYLNNNFINNGTTKPLSGTTYFKSSINPLVNTSGLTNAKNLYNIEIDTTPAVNLFKVSSPQNNRITYLGQKTRTFQINAALSNRGNNGAGDYCAFLIRKNGATTLTETNTLMQINNTADISSNSISSTVELALNDYIEIWEQRLVVSDTTSITEYSLTIN